MTKPITEYEIVDHGIDDASYFQGCGTSYTNFEDVATGNGDTYNEALDDALEGLAMRDWDVDGADLDSEKVSDERDVTISASAIIRDACECEECEICDEHLEECKGADLCDSHRPIIDCQGECNCAENAETYYYVSVRVR